jgi:hypothetical protein
MSVYGMSAFCHRLTLDPDHRNAAQNDLSAAMTRFDLTTRERQAIAEGDVGYLFGLGVHPLLLVRLCIYSIGRLTEPLYSERIRAWARRMDADGL